MKTILRFFYASSFVLTLVVGVAAVAGTRFALSLFLPSKPKTTEKIVPASLNGEFPSEPSLVDTQPEIFDAAGMYDLAMAKVPKAFKDFQMLEIETHKYSEENGEYTAEPINPIGYLQADKEFKFRSITLSDREITFETREINGVSYKFVGHFPKNPEFEYCESCEYPPDLKGKLTKFQNGKVVGETNAEFYAGGC